MKKIYFRVFASLCVLLAMQGLWGCKKGGFLAPAAVSNLTQSTVFADSLKTNEFLAAIYSQVGFDISPGEFGNGGIDASGDESQPYNLTPSDATYWGSGTINAAIVTNSVYNTCYTQIRAVNQLLKNIYQTRLTLPPSAPGSREQLKAEARFLRAWYYFILIKHYGGVPIVGDNIYNYTDAIPVKRASYSACVNYIVSQCDSAGLVLPLTQSGTGYGRASKGACMALKARVLLYAASPLFNQGSIDPGNALVGYTGPDSTMYRWALAKNAAAAVIHTNAYQLYVDNSNPKRPGNGFQALFCQRGDATQEYILQWMLPAGDYGAQLEAFYDPPSRGGSNGGFPYQETVDVFPMKDGKAITDNTSAYHYDPQNPYANRDPRMNFTIIHDQTILPVHSVLGARSPVNIYLISDPTINNGQPAGSGGDAVGSGTVTGYYTNKMLDTNATSTQFDQTTNRCEPLIRFAEVLLNFAEAKNEHDGPGSTADSVYSILRLIRQRAGIDPGSNGLFGLQPGMTQDQMRTAIQTERQLELAYEGFRFWDVRRWKIAATVENGQFHGMEVLKTIVRDANNNVTGIVTTYNVFPVLPVHAFTTRMYFWPLPQSEIGKSRDLVQNPLY